MDFYRVKMDIPDKGIKKGDIIVESIYHWERTVVIATPKERTKYLPFKITRFTFSNGKWVDKGYTEPLTKYELLKLKPHMIKTLMFDFENSMSEPLNINIK